MRLIPGTDYNNAFVHMIWHDSLYKDGLKLKSRVIRINGWDVAGRSYASIVKALESSTLPCVVDFKSDQWMDKMPHFPTERFQKRSTDLEMALKMSMDLEEDMESSVTFQSDMKFKFSISNYSPEYIDISLSLNASQC